MVTNEIKFTIDGEPMSKQRHRQTREGHTYTPEATVSYENLVRVCFSQAKPSDWVPHVGPVEMLVVAYFPIPKSWPKWRQELADGGRMMSSNRKDWDNIGKIVSDALNTVAYQDDKQIARATVSKYYSKYPRVLVVLMFHKPYTKEDAA